LADYAAIGAAIANRYKATIPAIRIAHAEPPSGLSMTPAVVVWPLSGDDTLTSGRLDGIADYVVNVYVDRASADAARISSDVIDLIDPARKALLGQAQLGVAGVLKALVVSWQTAVLDYAGVSYLGLTITVRVWTTESVTVTP
jgi:hypothetical protein